MTKFLPARIVSAALCAAALVACNPDRAAAPAPSEGLLSSLTTMKAVTRTTPLPQDYTVAYTLTPQGGQFSIPEGGLVVTVPKGAVSSNIAITATARAGSIVAFDFAPHGIVFNVPLQATVDLRNTQGITLLNKLNASSVYYADPSQLNYSTLTATATQVLGIVLDLNLTSATFGIPHFSGYMVSSGREDLF